jgi:hypothetical protein
VSKQTKRTAVIVDAIEIALGQLGKLGDSPEVEQLRNRALSCVRSVQDWAQSPPTSEHREAMMQQVLFLHTSVTKLGARQGGSRARE